MNGPILKNFQNTGDLGVKIFKTQFYCPKNLFVQNYLARTVPVLAFGSPWSNQNILLLAGNCN